MVHPTGSSDAWGYEVRRPPFPFEAEMVRLPQGETWRIIESTVREETGTWTSEGTLVRMTDGDDDGVNNRKGTAASDLYFFLSET